MLRTDNACSIMWVGDITIIILTANVGRGWLSIPSSGAVPLKLATRVKGGDPVSVSDLAAAEKSQRARLFPINTIRTVRLAIIYLTWCVRILSMCDFVFIRDLKIDVLVIVVALHIIVPTQGQASGHTTACLSVNGPPNPNPWDLPPPWIPSIALLSRFRNNCFCSAVCRHSSDIHSERWALRSVSNMLGYYILGCMDGRVGGTCVCTVPPTTHAKYILFKSTVNGWRW